jgi:sulfate/thiosulfate transport system substrate-binding protein
VRREVIRKLLLLSLLLGPACSNDDATPGKSVTLLNVSYDPTRELYEELNTAFAKHYAERTGVTVTIKQSHGGSGKQARSVIDGLEADVVSLALASDIDAIAKAGLTDPGWQGRLPESSSPYTSTIVFVVRAGNPKGIKDWDDLVKQDVAVITPNPKTSGGARWSYLAAWGYAIAKSAERRTRSSAEGDAEVSDKLGGDDKAKEFVAQLYKNVPVLDSGARGSTTTFVERKIGDVLIAWENEAYLAVQQSKGLELVVPTKSILAEPPVAIVDKVVAKHGTAEVAKAYLDFLYTDPAQAIITKHHYRARKGANPTPNLQLFAIDKFGGWTKAQATHFADGGTFDSIYTAK